MRYMVLVKWEKDGGRVSLRQVYADSLAQAVERAIIDHPHGTPIGVSKGEGLIFKAIKSRPSWVEDGDLTL